jgi:hypothetical protein
MEEYEIVYKTKNTKQERFGGKGCWEELVEAIEKRCDGVISIDFYGE